MHSENSSSHFDLCFNGYEMSFQQQKATFSTCTLPLPGQRPGVQSGLWSCHMHASALPMCSPLPGCGGEALESGTVSQVPAGYLGWERRAKWNGASGMAAGSRRSRRPTTFWRTKTSTPRLEHMWGGHCSLLFDYKLLTSWHSLYCVMCFWRATFLWRVSSSWVLTDEGTWGLENNLCMQLRIIELGSHSTGVSSMRHSVASYSPIDIWC